MEKYWEQKSDSLLKATQQEKYAEKLNQLPLDSGSLEAVKTATIEKGNLPDSSQLADKVPGSGVLAEYKGQLNNIDSNAIKEKGKELANEHVPDSSQVAGMAMEKAGLSEYSSELNALRSDSLSAAPQQYAQKGAGAVESQVSDRDEVDVFKDQKEELEALKNRPTSYASDVESYQDKEKLKEEALQRAKEEAMVHFVNNQEALGAAQKKIRVLQRKYSSVLNSNDLSTAVKRTSLKGRPFRERLFIGGNFNVNSLEPVSIDASPQVGYKFNKKFIVGIGGTYRHTFGKDTISSLPAIPDNSYGYRAFTSYDVFANFFIYGEYERMTKEIRASGTDKSSTQWVDGLLLGVGREFSVHRKVNMTIMVLYNFLHDPQNAIYPKPWTVKLGFQLSDLAMLKK